MTTEATKTTETESAFGCIGLYAYLMLILLWRGFVVTHLWQWFAAPFFSLPLLSVPMAMGLMLLGYTAKPTGSSDDDKKTKISERFAKWTLTGFFIPLYFLALGALLHWYMTR